MFVIRCVYLIKLRCVYLTRIWYRNTVCALFALSSRCV